MKNITSHTGTLEIVKRMNNSVNGNPRFELRVDGWTCRMVPDSMLAYQIEGWAGKTVEAFIGTHYGHATLDSIRILEV